MGMILFSSFLWMRAIVIVNDDIVYGWSWIPELGEMFCMEDGLLLLVLALVDLV